MSNVAPLYSIVLAAGKGRRMGAHDRHKVCFEVANIPTIVRAIDIYNRAGVTKNVVVVGEKAGQVIEIVGRQFSNVIFAYQSEALGTGHAAQRGLEALANVVDGARILVVAGDKIVDSAILSKLLERYNEEQLGLAFLVSPAQWGGVSAGRVLLDTNGRPAAIAEMADIRLRRCRREVAELLVAHKANTITWEAIRGIVSRYLGPDATLGDLLDGGDFEAAAPFECDELLATLRQFPMRFAVRDDSLEIEPEAAQNATLRNESVYLIRKDLFERGLRHMPSDNAQGQQYLTDAMGSVLQMRDGQSSSAAVGYVSTTSPFDVMSYNNPEELLQIEDHFQGRQRESLTAIEQRLGRERFKTVSQWLDLLSDDGPARGETDAVLQELYGTSNVTLLTERREAYRRALLRFQACFSADRHVILVRSPGRINIVGRHVDWQGGHCNLMAVNQEVVVAASPRADDRLEIRNVDPDQFPDASLSLGRMIAQLDWDGWLNCINSAALERYLRQSAGGWWIYIEAAMLRLQMAFPDRLLSGMDMAVCGSIPVAAGMSSSSALVVSTAETAVALHGLDVQPRQFVNFCGEGEWFVGTRGGSADHAAMKFGAAGAITHVKFHDFEVLKQVRFPDSHRMVVCNSFTQAQKAGSVKKAFNARVASYMAGVELVRKRFPQYAALIQYVRDIRPETLHVSVETIYKILLELPLEMSAAEIPRNFADDPQVWRRLQTYFDAAENDDRYPIRGVMLFGISECGRAREAARCLEEGDMIALGELMRISHDGERCFRVTDDLQAEPWTADISDDYLRRCIEDCHGGDPERKRRALLHLQYGAYRCSTCDIDAIVDIALRTPGVEGAQIAGAGLGGCAMVLARTSAVPALKERLDRLFYAPKNLPSGVIECIPAAGSCLVSISSRQAAVV